MSWFVIQVLENSSSRIIHQFHSYNHIKAEGSFVNQKSCQYQTFLASSGTLSISIKLNISHSTALPRFHNAYISYILGF
jgi:hypothetical protein